MSRCAALAYVHALNAHDAEAIAACVTEDFVNEHASSHGARLVGRDAYRQRLPSFLAEFDAIHYEPELVVADDEAVAIPYRMSATWLGRVPERHPLVLRGIFLIRTRDGLVAGRTDYWDSADFLRQTGQQ